MNGLEHDDGELCVVLDFLETFIIASALLEFVSLGDTPLWPCNFFEGWK